MKCFLTAACLVIASIAHGAETLRVVSAGPVGEVASLAEANEVRVVFSEPMVAVGRIPAEVTAPYFHMAPSVPGSFRWSGTTTLIFTPRSLPFATSYDITIDKAAASVAGNTLDRAYTFSFTTPTIQLLNTNWYRKANRAIVIGLRFNQPVDSQELLQRLQLRTAAHPFVAPVIPAEGVERLKVKEPQSLAAFEAKKVKSADASASNGAVVLAFAATEWDRGKLGQPKADLVVLETKPGIQLDTHINVVIDDKLAQGLQDARKAQRGRAQTYRIELEPTLFVESLNCAGGCDPDRYNGIRFRSADALAIQEVRKALTITDITDPANEVVLKAGTINRDYDYPSSQFSFDALGYSLLPAHRYLMRVDASLSSNDGQTLGYTWMGTTGYSHRFAFISFGDGEGVWESGGGAILPFHARNVSSAQQWLAPLKIDELMPILSKGGFERHQPGKATPRDRKFRVTPDKIQSHGVDITPAVGANGRGLLWVAVKPTETISSAPLYDKAVQASIVQATNLGLSIKDSPQGALIFATRLDNAEPVAGVNVAIRSLENKVVWSGVTDGNGLATATIADLRQSKVEKPKEAAGERSMDPDENFWDQTWRALESLHFIVTAEKDGDVAYVGSDWNEGITPWEFAVNFNIGEADPLLRGTIFSDRGVYKLGEEIHFKTIVRSDTPTGMRLLPGGTKVEVWITDSHSKEIQKRTLELNAWSSVDWTFRLPDDAPLGSYTASARIAGQRLRISTEFLVAAYRRPDFRVDTTLTAPSTIAGTKLDGKIVGRYLYGSAMAERDVTWTYDRQRVWNVPQAIIERFAPERYAFLGCEEEDCASGFEAIQTNDAKLDAKGQLTLQLDTTKDAGWPYEYRLEGDVTDVTRQKIAGRASFRVDPARWYIGLKRPPYFGDAAGGVDTEVVAAGLDGLAVTGVAVHLTLQRIEWNSVRQATGNGFYEWQTDRKDVDAGSWDITTKGEPVPLHIPLPRGGEYRLVAHANDKDGRSTETRTYFYAVGEGYTSWERYDHNRIDLIPEKKTYRPGETARIMIKSPWEKATALLTTEREGIRTSKQFTLTSTQQTVTVPITENEIPNVFVSVLLIKGRTEEPVTEDASDPGKPSLRLGYVELNVEDATKRLKVYVKADRDEFRPASKARIEVNVKDAAGKPSQSEVTLWAVDYGVLSLTGYQTPDVLESIYLHKALQVVNEDSRERIVSRRVITPKGANEGGGGGRDAGPGTLRKDFRVLAFWIGSVVTDARGVARTEVMLPQSLTTYRIMAVAGDRQSRFGWAQNEIRINKPVMLTAAFPRFLAVGDKASFGAVVHSQLKHAGNATVTITSLNPSVIEVIGETKQTVNVGIGSANEVRFDAIAKSVGSARIQMRVAMGREDDAFEDVIPVRILVSPETVAAYGEAKPQARELIDLPRNVVPGFGGLRIETSSTAMVGLAEGASYLVEYPYGCAEQRASGALALILSSELGDAFKLPGIDANNNRSLAQTTLNELQKFQCGDGGFSYWPGDCTTESPYLTSYILHTYQRGKKQGYSADADTLKRGYEYLERSLNEEKPVNEGWWPAFTAWQAFAVKTLAEGGRNVDTAVNRLYGYTDRMPLFGISHLSDAIIARGERGARLDELHRRMANAILPEGGYAHVEELADPYLSWFWNSNVRSTAIVLGSYVRHDQSEEIVKRLVRWLMRVRKDGRWGNTQENAWAMESLIDYYRKYESEVPDFAAVVTMGPEEIAREEFRGRSTEARAQDWSMQQVMAKGDGAAKLPVLFDRQGTGTLFYTMRLRYAPSDMKFAAMDQGFKIDRTYMSHDGTAPMTSFKAGDLVRVTLRIRNTKERRFVAVTDPIPAGTEPIETAFATTGMALVNEQQGRERGSYSWAWWQRGGFDHFERHDDRVDVFATRLSEGDHEYTYLVRATTSGTFNTAPAHAEEMYEPEVFGRTASAVIEVRP